MTITVEMLHLTGGWPGAKSLENVKSCVSPTGPDHSKNRETVNLDHCHQTGPVRGITSAYGQKCSRASSKPKISGLLQLTFLGSKTKQLLETYSRKLNLFLEVKKFKTETLETIRTFLQQGELVNSIDFKDAYFHIPIQEQSRKYLRFHIKGRTYQFKALPFGCPQHPESSV